MAITIHARQNGIFEITNWHHIYSCVTLIFLNSLKSFSRCSQIHMNVIIGDSCIVLFLSLLQKIFRLLLDYLINSNFNNYFAAMIWSLLTVLDKCLSKHITNFVIELVTSCKNKNRIICIMMNLYCTNFTLFSVKLRMKSWSMFNMHRFNVFQT